MSKKLTHEEFINKVRLNNEFFVNGDIEILGKYNGRHVPIQCYCNIHSYDWGVYPSTLYSGRGCPQCSWDNFGKNHTRSHDEFVNLVSSLNIDVHVIGQYINSTTKVKLQCSKGHVWDASPLHLLHDHYGCPYCSGHKVLVGETDMWTTRPDVAMLLKNIDDGYKYSYGSGVELEFICPDCLFVIKSTPNTISTYGLSCPRCSDGVSYPNKFGRAFLDQLPIENHQCEYQPDWAKPYFYDNYFRYNGKEYILEMDGAFHYIERNGIDKCLAERQMIDEIKDNLATYHNINVIRIDCMMSDSEYIKRHILQSCFNDIFDLSCINWTLCDSKAQNNLVKEACKLYMSGIYSTRKIGNKLHISDGTVCRYLKAGARFGWCDYDPKESKKRSKQYKFNNENSQTDVCLTIQN